IDWFLDTNYTTSAASKYNMFDVVLHELGHVGLLEHVNQSNDLMWYNVTPGATTNYISNDDVNGGTEVVTKSTQNSYTGSCIANGALIQLIGSCSMGSSGINQYLSNNYFLNLYPNPTGGAVLNINFQAPTNSQAQIVVYDMMGRSVSSNNLSDRNEINSTYSLDVSNLSQGMYMVNLIIDKVKVCQKFIKQ
ncbi:MAG: zinc-dependent metalloprotease, partial [Bacteroidia bacterium]